MEAGEACRVAQDTARRYYYERNWLLRRLGAVEDVMQEAAVIALQLPPHYVEGHVCKKVRWRLLRKALEAGVVRVPYSVVERAIGGAKLRYPACVAAAFRPAMRCDDEHDVVDPRSLRAPVDENPRLKVLADCLSRLTRAERRMLLSWYAKRPRKDTGALAARAGVKGPALRKRLERLRARLRSMLEDSGCSAST